MPKATCVRELSASVPVQSPSGFALAFLNTYIVDRGGGSNEAVLPLHLQVTQLAGLALERDVNVRVDYVPNAAGPAVLKIVWEPDATIFPKFDGTLTAQDAGDKHCTLTISGEYDVPYGVLGQIFDAVIGVRIAEGTLEQLLAEFRVAIEADYNRRMEYS